MIDFKMRVIELTSEKIQLESDYRELKNALDHTSFSDRTRNLVAKRLFRKKQAIEHCENNIKLSIRLDKQSKFKGL